MAASDAAAPALQADVPSLLADRENQEALRHAFSGGRYCLRCLGRPLAKAARATQNAQIGDQAATTLEIAAVHETACDWCEGLFADIDTYVDLVTSTLAPLEYTTFLIGTRLHPELIRKETAILTAIQGAAPDLAQHFEPMRNEMNREVGARVADRTGKEVQFERPDVNVLLDPHFDQVHTTLKSVYLYGRYRKFDRTIPQTKWPCRSCRGHGCKRCDGTGKTYPTSVEELVNDIAIPAFGSKEGAFHGAGREDIDALMLGTGRPFVIELKDPLYRTPRAAEDASQKTDLATLEAAINTHARPRVEIEGLRYSDKDEVVAIKEGAQDKAYRAHVIAEAPITRATLDEAVRTLTGATIEQRTPERVSHRRADLVRKRTVHTIEVTTFGRHTRATHETEGPGNAHEPEPGHATTFTLDILAQSGTYIKELVHGDEGRTQPNLSALVGVPMQVAYLDVVGVGEPGVRSTEALPQND